MILVKLLAPLLVCLAAASRQLKTKLLYISTDQTVNIGERVQLNCSVNHGGDYTVLWLHVKSKSSDTPSIISSGSSLLTNNTRYSVIADRANSTYHLQIGDIQDTDEGRYLCHVIITPNERISKEVKLQIRKPPIILNNSTNILTSMEGHLIKLECYASGFPPPQISWHRENNIPLPSGATIYRGNILEIGNSTKEDRGIYYCVADNGVGKPRRHSVELRIEFLPIVTVTRPRVGQALHYIADIECNVEGYPDPGIYWIRNGTILQNNRKYMIAHFSMRGGIAITVLRIIEVQPNDYGLYVCKTSNKMGESSATAELFETQDPVCPPACSAQPIVPIPETTNSTVQGKK